MMSTMFDSSSTSPAFDMSFEWTDEQIMALEKIDAWYHINESSFFALTGPAGTGKTTLVREIASRYHIALAAMTGKAALRLGQCTGRVASTLHSILYYPPAPSNKIEFVQLRDPEAYLIAIDEASMMSPGVYEDLQKWARLGVRFLLVGDSYQLPPVITGQELKKYGEDYSVFSHVKGVALETVMRNAGGVLRAATVIRNTGNIHRRNESDESEDGYEYHECDNPLERGVDMYLAEPHDHLLVTWKNANRMRANHMIRERIDEKGPLPNIGEPVLVRRNGQGFMNGEIVKCGEFSDGPMLGEVVDKKTRQVSTPGIQTLWMTTLSGSRILVCVDGGDRDKGGDFFDGQMPWVKNWRKYLDDLAQLELDEPSPVTWGYCLTAHTSQGSEAKRVTVFLCAGDENNRNFRKPTTLPNGTQVPFASRFIYTAITRGKKRSTMIVAK